MENKLQELTTKIYEEGVAKAREEADKILEEARKQADQIRSTAKKEAQQIMDQAEKETNELKRNTESEIKLTARQALASIKQQIVSLVTAKSTKEPIEKAFEDKEFLKKIIETTIRNWNPGKDSFDLQLLLPKQDEKTLGEYFASKQKDLLRGGLDIRFDERMNAGFKIGPADGRFLISFSDEDFDNFFRNYLRPRTTKLLFGGE